MQSLQHNDQIFSFILPFSCSDRGNKFFVLGSGTPNPNPDRSGSAYLVLANDTPYLFDFGPGVVRKMSALSKSWGGAYSELEVENLEYAFLTHFHSDHSLGLADLIITPWIMGGATVENFWPSFNCIWLRIL